MKLEEQIFNIVDETGKPIDVSKEPKTDVLFNGEKCGLGLSEIFIKITELNKGEICGNSLLQYYKIGEDGLLHDKEGNTIGLSTDKGKVLFKSIEEPTSTYGAVHINLEYVKNFASAFNIQKADELFIDLSPNEKEIVSTERNASIEAARIKKDKEDADALVIYEAAKKQKETEDAIAAAAEKKKKDDADALLLQQQQEAEKNQAIRKFNDDRKKIIPKNLIVEETEFQSLIEHYKSIGFKQYEKGDYIFFYGTVDEETEDVNEPFLLIKRNDWYEEPEEGELKVETDENVEYEFSDADKTIKIELDFKKDEVIVILGQEPV